ncbi:MAG TPA: metal-sulfur cluster assembly factor [Xanthobacteraceae bacterium]|nr:metal-sulfur cluster assembly factor [Xanthobacteraceae bacterium]
MSPISVQELLAVLQRINDPEFGMSIVDLGLVYRAACSPEGIDIALTLTTPSCPLGETLVAQIRTQLHHRFPDAPPINVELVWDPPWTPDRMSLELRRRFS